MRADLYLTSYGYAESRQKAAAYIKKGYVTVDNKKIVKPSEEINENVEHNVTVETSDEDRYVSRGALKLAAALEKFKIDVNGLVCADIGASTGGFTDCLLQNGAELVYAFDSGKGQLHPRLAADERVVSREGFNARYLTLGDVGNPVDIAVMDVSFISQTLIIPNLCGILKDGGAFVSLIKPQFEAGREALGKNGIVKKWEHKLFAVERVVKCAVGSGLQPRGLIVSPIKGGDGNEEYLAYFVKDPNVAPNQAAQFASAVRATVKSGQ